MKDIIDNSYHYAATFSPLLKLESKGNINPLPKFSSNTTKQITALPKFTGNTAKPITALPKFTGGVKPIIPIKPDLKQIELSFWTQALKSNTIAAYQSFISRFPHSIYANTARQKIALLQKQHGLDMQKAKEKAAWTAAYKSNTIAAYQSFISRFPKGTYVNTARQKIALLQKKDALNALRLREKKAWNIAIQRNKIPDYQSFISRFPKSTYVNLAKQKIAALQAEYKRIEELQRKAAAERLKQIKQEQQNAILNKAKNAKTVDEYTKYIAQLPAGFEVPTNVVQHYKDLVAAKNAELTNKTDIVKDHARPDNTHDDKINTFSDNSEVNESIKSQEEKDTEELQAEVIAPVGGGGGGAIPYDDAEISEEEAIDVNVEAAGDGYLQEIKGLRVAGYTYPYQFLGITAAGGVAGGILSTILKRGSLQTWIFIAAGLMTAGAIAFKVKPPLKTPENAK